MTTDTTTDTGDANISAGKESRNNETLASSSLQDRLPSSNPPSSTQRSSNDQMPPPKNIIPANTGADGGAGGVLVVAGHRNTGIGERGNGLVGGSSINNFAPIPETSNIHRPHGRDRSISLGSPVPSPHRSNQLRNNAFLTLNNHHRSTPAAGPPINAFHNVPLLPNLAVSGNLGNSLHHHLGATMTPTHTMTPNSPYNNGTLQSTTPHHLRTPDAHVRTIAHISNLPDMGTINTSASVSSVSPTPSISSHHSSTKAVIDAAMAQERQRAKDMESSEQQFREISQFQHALKQERSYSAKLAGELAALRSAAVASHSEAEAHEEGRINGLMRRLDGLQREKGRIIIELEREEEMLTNTLQKKLNEVRREKAQLEKQIQREHSFNSELQSKLLSVQASAASSSSKEEIAPITPALTTSSTPMSGPLSTTVTNSASYTPTASTLTAMMEETSMEE